MKKSSALKNLLGAASVILVSFVLYKFFGMIFAIFVAVGMVFILWDTYKTRRD